MSFNFDLKLHEQKVKQNVLEAYKNNAKITKTVIPSYEIMFREDSGFGLYACEDEKENQFTVKGTFISELIIGQTYLVDGYVTAFKGEKQLSVNTIKNVKPVNKKGIVSYLQTLKGLKSKAELIYDEFGEKSIDVLMDDPMQVVGKIKGIGQKSVVNWQEQLNKMKDSQATVTTLLGYGLTMKQARKLYEAYKEDIIVKIEENPYFLASEVRGYGFDKCDKIARNIGLNPKSVFRLQEGLMHVLKEASMEGHCYLPVETLLERAKTLLSIRLTGPEMSKFSIEHQGKSAFSYSLGEMSYVIPYNEMINQLDLFKNERNPKKREGYRYEVVALEFDEIAEQMKEIALQSRTSYEDGNVYLRQLYLDEKQVSVRVKAIAKETSFKRSIELENELNQLLEEKSISLEAMQYKAVVEFASYKGGFYVLNGSAGCGKTFTLKIILQVLEKQYIENGGDFRVKVLAPTGKASKVATKSTGMECVTVHRGLGYNPHQGFEYNEDNPFEAEVIVVDESSMLDISLCKSLLNAISAGTKVIFMGDTKQLPSVGAGNVLFDLIESGTVKVVTLNVVKRQGKLSGIVKNANKIINGETITSCEDTKDAYVLHRQTVEGIQRTILQSISNILKFDGFGFEDIQVLCPQRTGQVGTYMLNYLIQQEFNKNEGGITVLNRKFQVTLDPKKAPEMLTLNFRKGDKVIHVKNNYDMEWYVKGNFGGYIKQNTLGITNGECGVIEDIVKEKNTSGDTFTRIIVRYEDEYVFYDDGFEELDHSFALTIHKSQGSQWKAVILPIAKQNYMMLDNNLFYTGYTRAELFSCVIGQPEAIAHAVKTSKSRDRYTALDKKIQEKNVA